MSCNTRHIFIDTLSCVYKIIKINIFFRPEEAMLENWRKLISLLKNCVLFLRNFKLHDVKQNEKYPFALIAVLLKSSPQAAWPDTHVDQYRRMVYFVLLIDICQMKSCIKLLTPCLSKQDSFDPTEVSSKNRGTT